MTAPQRFSNSASGLSSALCTYLAGCRFEDLPFEVIRSAQRGILDWIGCALAGSDHASLEPLLVVLQRLSGRAAATVFGRPFKLGIADAAVANGYMGHVLDY